MIESFVKFEECINNCLLSRLSKPSHEKDYHSEYQIRTNKLEQYLPKLLDLVENVDFREQQDICSSTLYSLLILYMELKTEGPWNTENIKTKDYPTKLNLAFKNKYNITLERTLLKNDVFNAQEIFDKCIRELHQKMTLSDFKKYPSLVEVYCMLIKNLHEYNLTINSVAVLPVALLLTDDYITSNKIKGLQCCVLIMQCLKPGSFTNGNYYEVVYMSLKKNIYEKDIEVTKALFECFPEFLKNLPLEVKKIKLDDVYSSVLDQLNTETNLYRKAVCFDFTTKIIEMHRVHCVKKKIFKDIICDNLEMCCNEGVYEILIQHVMECFLMWIRYCWCIWKLSTDQKILAALIKTLYVAKDDTTISQIQNLIIALIHLCSKEEQMQICSNLETVPKGLNNDFLIRINAIKESIFI
ncbi:hypothetical protein PYW08_001764 [Mythimna loreyi]|uniref:Uncharacterized protein n=1 Tax=Mythimna loreyi TaxID=667449 RepID=A0ACC2RAA5_9NEOP|nr:hypothetical protein PYW08_001764 [Mythimna loreyi]